MKYTFIRNGATKLDRRLFYEVNVSEANIIIIFLNLNNLY
jgi:hypothetical protein